MANEFKKGDKVRIVRKVESYANGWDNVWVGSMDNAVGCEGAITEDLGDSGFSVSIPGNDGNGYAYPAEALELVTEEAPKDEPATFKPGDRVEYVGGYFESVGSEISPELIGKRGSVVEQTSATNVGVTWDVPGGCTGVFPQNLRKLEAWEVAMESGEFYFKHYQNTRNDYHAKKQGGDWIVSWDDGITFFADGTAVECLRKGWWLLIDPPAKAPTIADGHLVDFKADHRHKPDPDPVAEAAAAYKAAKAAHDAALLDVEAAQKASREAYERQYAAHTAMSEAHDKLLEVAAG